MPKEKLVKFNKTSEKVVAFRCLAEAFYEASKISFSLVFFPIVLLLIAVWLDKKLSTTPLFIIVGIIFGVVLGIYQAVGVRKKVIYRKKNKNG